jgi:hypothetical protein
MATVPRWNTLARLHDHNPHGLQYMIFLRDEVNVTLALIFLYHAPSVFVFLVLVTDLSC